MEAITQWTQTRGICPPESGRGGQRWRRNRTGRRVMQVLSETWVETRAQAVRYERRHRRHGLAGARRVGPQVVQQFLGVGEPFAAVLVTSDPIADVIALGPRVMVLAQACRQWRVQAGGVGLTQARD
jgi:hypothetical protein